MFEPYLYWYVLHISICCRYAVEKGIRVPQCVKAADIQTIIASTNSSISPRRMSSSMFRRTSAITSIHSADSVGP